jgi:hypothetical protein
VQPELQRFVAKLMGATSYEAESSHVPMLSNSDLVIDVIRTAARRIKRLKEGVLILTISPDYSHRPTPDFLALSLMSNEAG